jgi:serine/threonine protein kinase
MREYPEPVVSGGDATVRDTIISIDDIRLDRVLGSGANGFVFDGEDLLLKRRVAVKIWPPRLDRPGKDRAIQALAEAQKLARLKSDVIVPIYHAGRLDNNWIYAVMEYGEGVPFTDEVRAELTDVSGFAMRMMWWGDVHRGLSDAERVGVYHGDLHGGNVLVRPFHATLIDFGTSALAGKSSSLKRHARMVNEFAQRLLQELTEYIAPLDIRKLSEPKFATFLVGEWVDACRDLQELEKEISALTEKDLAWRLTLLAENYSTNLVDLNRPIAMWLENSGVPRKLLDTYAEKAEAEVACRRKRWQSDTRFKGKP